MELVLTKEQQDKLDAIKAARVAKASARNEASNEAHVKHLFEHAGGDEMGLIVYTLPAHMGGKVIYRVPIHEVWAKVQKAFLDAIVKDSKGTPTSAAAIIVESPSLLLHPDISTLQSYRDEIPGLYMEIKEAFETRCDKGQIVSGK
jgi:hypothetical protein